MKKKKKKELEFLCIYCKKEKSKHAIGTICKLKEYTLQFYEPETNLEYLARICKK